jgi:RNase P protein component
MKEDETNGKYVINGVNRNRSKRLTTEAQGTDFVEDKYVDISVI